MKKNYFYVITGLLLFWQTSQSLAGVTNYTPHTDYAGTYSLPIKHELSEFAEWKLQDLKWFRNNQIVKVTYKLPDLLLDDADQEIEMTGKKTLNNPFFQLNGARATAVCTELLSDQFVCLVRFEKQKMKFKSDLSFFAQRFPTGDEGQRRFEVAKAFSSEPIGILRIEKR